MKKLISGLLMAGALALGIVGAAQAAYPEKPIRFIVVHSAGGASDVVSRILAKHMEVELGVPVVIVNVAGSGGAVGYTRLMNSEPDGYTISQYDDSMGIMEATGAVTFSHKNFQPVAMFGVMYVTVFTKPGKYGSLADMAADAKSRPGQVGLAMGHGTPAQFYAKMVEDAMGVDLNLVNVGGGAQKKAAVLGGHVDAGIEPMPGIIGSHRSGQLKVIAVMAPERLEGFDAPTAREQGVDVLAFNSYGLLAPEGTPIDRAKVLAEAVAKVTKKPEYIEQMRKVNFDPLYKDTQGWSDHLDAIRAEKLKTGKALGF
jgi:tripartite-type tricarboxylate transporter receptor subunit TctC